MNAPSIMLKVIVLIHFIFSVWGSMSSFMPQSYVYVHIGVLLCGLWAIASATSTDAVIMMLATLAFSAIQDIILLGLYEPRGHQAYEERPVSENVLNEYRFALGMSILNLILKPFTGFLLFRIYQSRNNETAFSIPGINRIPGLGGVGTGGYEDIDSRRTPQYSSVPVETASPHLVDNA